MSEPFTAERVTYLRPRRVLAASMPAIAGAPVLFWAAVLTHTPLLAGIAPLVCVLGVVGASAWFANRWPGRVSGRVVAGEEGVLFDGRLLSRREEIKAGVVVPKGLGPPAVRLERRWQPPIDLEVADDRGRRRGGRGRPRRGPGRPPPRGAFFTRAR